MTNETILDLDALLDSTMDNVPDVPDYVTPPDGNYRLKVGDAKLEEYTSKNGENTGKKGLRIKLQYSIVTTIETKEVPVPDGSLFTETFIATEDGLKFFKKQATKILGVSDLNGVPIREVLASLKEAEFDARITTKKNAAGYENTNVRPLLAEDSAPAA